MSNLNKKKGLFGKIVKWCVIGFIALVVLAAVMPSDSDKKNKSQEVSSTKKTEELKATAEETEKPKVTAEKEEAKKEKVTEAPAEKNHQNKKERRE